MRLCPLRRPFRPAITVTLLSALSVAAAGAAVPRARHVVSRSPLSLDAPGAVGPILAGMACAIALPTRYTGDGVVSYAILSGPAGMTIDDASGTLAWTPAPGDEGREVDVEVGATDGQYSDEISFHLRVAAPTAVPASLAGSTLTVTGAGSLQGVDFTFPAAVSTPLAQVEVGVLAAGEMPALPAGFQAVSQPFRATPVEAGGDDAMITVSLPSRLVPAGAQPQDLRLLVYTERLTNLGHAAWVPTWSDLDVLPDGTVTLLVRTLGELCVVAADRRSASATAAAAAAWDVPASLPLAAGALDVTVACERKLLANGTRDSRQAVCTVTGDTTLNVTVKDLATNLWVPGGTHEALLRWLAAAKMRLESRGLTASPRFDVVVEPMAAGDFGYVSGVENYRVLHLTTAAYTGAEMQATAAHEYFHHAQSRTRIAGLGNLLADGGRDRQWLIEGTAVWFEDDVFDDLNSYKAFFGSPLRPILSRGLVKAWLGIGGGGHRDPYATGLFFKLLRTRCPGMSLKHALNCDMGMDSSGVENLAALIATTAWQCDFGDGFGGGNKAVLGSALLSYVHATQMMNDVSLLDPDESAYAFTPPMVSISPSSACRDAATCPRSARVSGTFAPAAAQAVVVNPVAAVPASQEAVLELEIGESPVWAWVGDAEKKDALAAGRYYDRSGSFELPYGEGGRAPKLLVVLVNPSTTENAQIALRARLRDRPPVDTPFSGAVTAYPDLYNSLMYDVHWTMTTSGTVTAPAGFTVGTVRGYPSGDLQMSVFGTSSAPVTVTVAGILDDVPDTPSGSVLSADRTYYKNWSYTNRMLQPDYPAGALQSGLAFSYTVQCDTVPCSKRLVTVVTYDLDYWLSRPSGTVYYRDSPRAQPKGGLTITVNVNAP